MAHQRTDYKCWNELTEDEVLQVMTTSKTYKTKVFSGSHNVVSSSPDDIDAELDVAIKKAAPSQLLILERLNPHLIGNTDDLWTLHCHREFRSTRRLETETWRQTYLRCSEEREAKLKAITENIKRSQQKALPAKHTKMAYIDSVVKPTINVTRQPTKNGVERNTPSSRLAALATAGFAEKVKVRNPGSRVSAAGKVVKPQKAPLTLNTLQSMKKYGLRR